MRNRNWDRDFDSINQSNVNRVHVNRSGERQYDSGYSNPYGLTSFEQEMHNRDHSHVQNWVRTGEDRYHPSRRRDDEYAPSHSHSRADFDERQHLYNRHPDENATDQGFFGRIGERVGEFLHEGREQVEHLFDRFGNRRNDDRDSNYSDRNYQGNYNREYEYDRNRNRQSVQGRPDGPQWNTRHGHREPGRGYENSYYNPGNQGQVQGHRYQDSDYSLRSSYRLLDSNSGYGQGGYSYASDRDSD